MTNEARVPNTLVGDGDRTKVVPLVNLNGHFRPADLQAHRFATDPALVLNTAFDADPQTLDEAWAIGNRAEYDPVTKDFWPEWCRSLSVGDLLVITGGGRGPVAYSIDPEGFTEVSLDEVTVDWDDDRHTLANWGHAAPLAEVWQ